MRSIIVALFFLLMLILTPCLSAQNPVSGGSISGIVADISGGTVGGASVTLTNVSTISTVVDQKLIDDLPLSGRAAYLSIRLQLSLLARRVTKGLLLS